MRCSAKMATVRNAIWIRTMGRNAIRRSPLNRNSPIPAPRPPRPLCFPRGPLNCLNISRHYHGMICQLAIQFKMWYSCIHTTPSCEWYATVVFFSMRTERHKSGPKQGNARHRASDNKCLKTKTKIVGTYVSGCAGKGARKCLCA
jgi:hypothetical protein